MQKINMDYDNISNWISIFRKAVKYNFSYVEALEDPVLKMLVRRIIESERNIIKCTQEFIEIAERENNRIEYLKAGIGRVH